MTAQEIVLNQMGGTGRLFAMIGAKWFMYSPESRITSFHFAGTAKIGNICDIKLAEDDTYTMTLTYLRGVNLRCIRQIAGLHAEQLKPAFESQTGLRLSL